MNEPRLCPCGCGRTIPAEKAAKGQRYFSRRCVRRHATPPTVVRRRDDETWPHRRTS